MLSIVVRNLARPYANQTTGKRLNGTPASPKPAMLQRPRSLLSLQVRSQRPASCMNMGGRRGYAYQGSAHNSECKTSAADHTGIATVNAEARREPRLAAKPSKVIGNPLRHDALTRLAVPSRQPGNARMIMKQRIQSGLNNEALRAAFMEKLQPVFHQAGMETTAAALLARRVVKLARSALPLAQTEWQILQLLSAAIARHDTGQSFVDVVHAGLAGRTEVMFKQLSSDLDALREKKILDFGAGNLQLAQMVYERISKKTVGVDVAPYSTAGLTVPTSIYDGRQLHFTPGSFDAVIATNVFHHEQNNQTCLDQIRKILKPGGKLLVIETVPTGATPQEVKLDTELTYLFDWLYNPVLYGNPAIPVPGTYETSTGWEWRFENNGFTVEDVEQLGRDQPLIPDWHVRYTLGKR
ncbi:MAG: class I SAM-dependent methyltransferase [Janthinobacterium lividum]